MRWMFSRKIYYISVIRYVALCFALRLHFGGWNDDDESMEGEGVEGVSSWFAGYCCCGGCIQRCGGCSLRSRVPGLVDGLLSYLALMLALSI